MIDVRDIKLWCSVHSEWSPNDGSGRCPFNSGLPSDHCCLSIRTESEEFIYRNTTLPDNIKT